MDNKTNETEYVVDNGSDIGINKVSDKSCMISNVRNADWVRLPKEYGSKKLKILETKVAGCQCGKHLTEIGKAFT